MKYEVLKLEIFEDTTEYVIRDNEKNELLCDYTGSPKRWSNPDGANIEIARQILRDRGLNYPLSQEIKEVILSDYAVLAGRGLIDPVVHHVGVMEIIGDENA